MRMSFKLNYIGPMVKIAALALLHRERKP